MISVDLMTIARKVNNYIEDATDIGAGNDKFTSTTAQTFTVPPGKRWFVIGMHMKRDASATLAIVAKDSSDKSIMQLIYSAASTSNAIWPTSFSSADYAQPAVPLVLDAGEYIDIAFGAAQGGGCYGSCIVLEIDV